MNKKSYIGVDLHTDCFTCCTLQKDERASYDTYDFNKEGLRLFIETLHKIDEVAVEATGNAAFFVRALKGKAKKVTLVATGQFAIIGKSIKKSDVNDSYWLAYFLLKNMLPKARLKPAIYTELRSLIDTRASLVRMRSALINKTYSILIRNGFKLLKEKLCTKSGYNKYVFSQEWPEHAQWELSMIYAQVLELNKAIELFEEKIASTASTLYGYENLLSIKGIGPLSAATLICIIADVNDFPSPSHLSSYFGIVPRMHQSNETLIMGRITKAGSKLGRCTLVQCTWVAVKYSPYLKEYYERIKARGCAQKAIIACSRKLLTTIFYTLKNDWVFDDFTQYQYHIKNSETQQIAAELNSQKTRKA